MNPNLNFLGLQFVKRDGSMRSDDGVEDLKRIDDLPVLCADLDELFGRNGAGLVDVEFLFIGFFVGRRLNIGEQNRRFFKIRILNPILFELAINRRFV